MAKDRWGAGGGGFGCRAGAAGLIRVGLLAVALAAGAGSGLVKAGTLEDIHERGTLLCGVSDSRISAELLGEGRWIGFEVEVCRAMAAAVVGDAERAEFLVLNPQTRFEALLAGVIDVLFGNTTWTYARDVKQAVEFVAVVNYDGQRFIGRPGLPSRLSELRDVTVCVMKQTTTEQNLADYIRVRAPSWRSLVMNTERGRDEAFLDGRCDLLTDDGGALVSLQANHLDRRLYLYPDVISKEPQSAVVRSGDEPWFKTVRWMIHALINAEELGVGRDTVTALAAAGDDAALRPLLGQEAGFGDALGLSDRWAFEMIRQVGNYGEIFERSLGSGSALKMERGLNRLWNQGGLMYAPPLR